MIQSSTFINKNNCSVLQDAIAVDLNNLRKKRFAILESYVSEEMQFFKKSLPVEKLEITSIKKGFDNLELKYNVVDPSIKGFEKDLENCDFAFLNLYGEYGEDGRVQGLLDFLKISYNGSGVLGSALFIDKLIAKLLLKSQGHLTADFTSNRLASSQELKLPVMLKTYRGGSSVRMQHITDVMPASIEEDCFLEEFIDGRLITVSFIEQAGDVFIMPPLEVIFNDSTFYNDVAKVNRTTSYRFPDLSEYVLSKISSLIKDSYNLLDLRNYGRIDYILHGEQLYYLEINTIPGLLDKGNYALCFKEAGIDYSEMISMIVSSALQKKSY